MISLTTGQLETWLDQVLWPFIRVGSGLMVAPVFSGQTVPVRIRIVLAGAIALILAPTIVIPPELSAFSIAGLVVTAQQVVIGIALGFCLQLVFDAITLGGQLIANSMGLSYALSLDPVRGTGSTALGEMYSIFVTLVFLALNGHLRLIEVLADGFRTLPIGGSGFGPANLWQVVIWGGTLFGGALSIALPAITALLIVNLAFGMVSRAAPALNLMAVGFPVMLIFGLLVLVVSVPQLLSGFERLLEQVLHGTAVTVGRTDLTMAENENGQDRTEQPTQKRLDEARRSGQVPRSRDLTTAAVVLIAGLGLRIAGSGMASGYVGLMKSALSLSREQVLDENRLLPELVALAWQGLIAAAPIMGLTMVAALLAPLAIGGWNMSFEALVPNFSRLNLVEGLKRLFTMARHHGTDQGLRQVPVGGHHRRGVPARQDRGTAGLER